MKANKFTPALFLIILVLGSGCLISCKIEKRLYQPGYHIEWVKSPAKEKKSATADMYKDEKNSDKDNQQELSVAVTEQNLSASISELPEHPITELRQLKLNESIRHIQPECETLVLNDMSKMNVNLIEIGIHELVFKDCGRSVGKTFTISKSEVARIIYSDGTMEEIFYNENAERDKYNSNTGLQSHRRGEARSLDVVGIFSLVFGNFASFSAAIALFIPEGALIFTVMALTYGILSLITGIISLAKISSAPDQYSGRGAAILGLILGIINIIFAVLVFTAVVILLSL